MSLVVREFTRDDFVQLQGLYLELDRQHHLELPWMFASDPGVRNDTYFKKIIANKNETFLVAVEESILGFLQLRNAATPQSSLFVSRTSFVIDAVYVAPTARRRGVGRALFAAAEQLAQEHQVDGLRLNVFEFNQTAQAFFESLGFETTQRKMLKRLD